MNQKSSGEQNWTGPAGRFPLTYRLERSAAITVITELIDPFHS